MFARRLTKRPHARPTVSRDARLCAFSRHSSAASDWIADLNAARETPAQAQTQKQAPRKCVRRFQFKLPSEVAGKQLCNLTDLVDGEPRELVVESQDALLKLIAVRKGAAVYGHLNRCPHMGIPLHWNSDDDFLTEDGSRLRCASHGCANAPNS